MPEIVAWPCFNETRPIGKDDTALRPPRFSSMPKVQAVHKLWSEIILRNTTIALPRMYKERD